MSKQRIVYCNHFQHDLDMELGDRLPSSIFVLTDDVTQELCLPLLHKNKRLKKAHTIVIPHGDEHKTIETLVGVWKYLSENGATRKSLVINLGGGMITDLGGFAASTFKRGIRYINIPTTLLSAVDAAVGGKTGINFLGFKNEIGVFNPADVVLIETAFLHSLDYKNLLSGFAEILKHALISSRDEWEKICRIDLLDIQIETLKSILQRSIAIKEFFVEKDPLEADIRKALNLGHTIGHAFESYSHEKKQPVLHGYAVAWGIVCELYLSHKKLGFPKELLLQALAIIKEAYGGFSINCKDYPRLYELMTHDKKNEFDEINLTLLRDIGEIRINQITSQEEIFETLDFYQERF